jgi:hypothetical protein
VSVFEHLHDVDGDNFTSVFTFHGEISVTL